MGILQGEEQGFCLALHLIANLVVTDDQLQRGFVIQNQYQPLDIKVGAAAAESANHIFYLAVGPAHPGQGDSIPAQARFPEDVVRCQLYFSIGNGVL